MASAIPGIPKAQWCRSPQAIGAAFLLLFAIPLLLWSSYVLNYHNENTNIEHKTLDITHDVGAKLAEIDTVMASLVGIHYATKSLDVNELMLFAQELRSHNNFISGVGRYEKIPDSERGLFESRMGDAGLFNFQITDIENSGATNARIKQEFYYPTSMLDPHKPENIKLLGADLGTIDNLKGKLDAVTAENKTLLGTFPDNWPTSGDLVLFRPVYLGKKAPLTAKDRIAQSAGGFWISIDLEALTSEINPKLKTFDFTISIVSDGNARVLFSQLGAPEYPAYLTSLYTRSFFSKEWNPGISSVLISLEADIGFTGQMLGLTVAALISLLLVTGLYTAHIIVRRAAFHQHLANKEVLFREREKAVTTLNSVQDAIITIDANMQVIHINPAAMIQFNKKPSSTVGQSLSNMVQFQLAGDTSGVFNIEQALENLVLSSKNEFDVTPVGCDHNEFVLRLTLSSSFDVDDNATGHVLVLRDISHERKLSDKLAFQANHDSLTGCTNRFYFEQTLAGLIDKLPFSTKTHTLCYMDLDQFKVINDTCGHRAGDRLLTELTAKMLKLIDDGDVLSRLGGDEFGILMIDISQENALERANKIYQFFQTYIFRHEEKAFAVRVSVGIVHIDQTCISITDVMSAADIACYAAKDAGRNSMYVYCRDDDIMAERSVELSWLPRLQNAIQDNEFRLYVQAVASVSSFPHKTEIQHFEFLLRLANPDGSVSTPWQFIQAAERYDLMRDIDKWVIRNALQKVAELTGGPAGDCSFSINLSGQSAADPGLKEYIREQMLHYGVNPTLIWFELTETAAISQFSTAVELINDIQQLGCKVALDDFGSGLSSFGYLKNLPVDILKIDGQFIREIALNNIDREMVRAIHQVGQSMGIKTVAEFVENQDIVDVLVDIGIDYAQGYHIGKPCPMEEAVARLSPMDRAA